MDSKWKMAVSSPFIGIFISLGLNGSQLLPADTALSPHEFQYEYHDAVTYSSSIMHNHLGLPVQGYLRYSKFNLQSWEKLLK